MCVSDVMNDTLTVTNVAVNRCMTHTVGMSARATFGQWLRSTRLEHCLSQEALAQQAGVDRTYVANLERTTTWPRDPSRAKFHAVFGTGSADFRAMTGNLSGHGSVQGRIDLIPGALAGISSTVLSHDCGIELVAKLI